MFPRQDTWHYVSKGFSKPPMMCVASSACISPVCLMRSGEGLSPASVNNMFLKKACRNTIFPRRQQTLRQTSVTVTGHSWMYPLGHGLLFIHFRDRPIWIFRADADDLYGLPIFLSRYCFCSLNLHPKNDNDDNKSTKSQNVKHLLNCVCKSFQKKKGWYIDRSLIHLIWYFKNSLQLWHTDDPEYAWVFNQLCIIFEGYWKHKSIDPGHICISILVKS